MSLGDAGKSGGPERATTQLGFRNANGQEVVGKTSLLGTDYLQKVYLLRCTLKGRGIIYGTNGSDIHGRRCPRCQDGTPRIPIAIETR